MRTVRTSPPINAQGEEAQGPEGWESRTGGDTTNATQKERRSGEAVVRLEMKPALEQRGDVQGLDGRSRGETLVNLPIFVCDNHTITRNHSPLEAIPRSQLQNSWAGAVPNPQKDSETWEQHPRHEKGRRKPRQ